MSSVVVTLIKTILPKIIPNVLLTFFAGKWASLIIGAVVSLGVLGLVGGLGYRYVYKPAWQNGYDKAFYTQQEIITALVDKHNQEVQDRINKLAEVQNQLNQVVTESQEKQDELTEAIAQANKRYEEARRKLRQNSVANAAGKLPGIDVPLVENGKWYAPLDTAGLSKPGVEAVQDIGRTLLKERNLVLEGNPQ